MSNVQEEFNGALRQVERASRHGDFALAERWSKVAERLSLAIKNAAPEQSSDDERQELGRRLSQRVHRIIEAQILSVDWYARRDAYIEIYQRLAAEGATLPPLPPCPALDDEQRAIISGKYDAEDQGKPPIPVYTPIPIPPPSLEEMRVKIAAARAKREGAAQSPSPLVGEGGAA